LAETVAYAESNLCRRRTLLFYFGELYGKVNCGSCDNCIKEKQMEEGKDYMYLLLEAVKDTKQQFKERHIVNLLVGNHSPDIKQFKHDELSRFGEGQDKSEKFWFSIIRQALFENLLVNDVENADVLKVSAEGERFLKRPYSIQIVGEKPKQDEDEELDMVATPKGGAVDKVLFSMLKDLLKTIAKHENLPPYVVFQETSLEDMCIQYPITLDEMTQISGVGAGKAQKYGQPFINLICKYVEDNEIERPQDIIVKSIVNKSGMKVFIIQNIDRKIHLEDIAESKNLTMEELLTEIESIVSSGTKINIDYYIEANIDRYHQEEILDYLQEAQEDSLETALEELGEEDYTMEEIRLMRIKFLSDKGN
jgi:ATP-dependent DNA helicase RecQ